MAEILRVENLCKTYFMGKEKVEALKGIDLELHYDEVLAIMGSSGSGKSTFLHIVGALDTPTEGKIYLNHTYEKSYSMEPYATKIRAEYIGFIFQQYNLINDLTVRENISLPLILNNERKDKINLLVDEKLRQVDLYDRQNHPDSAVLNLSISSGASCGIFGVLLFEQSKLSMKYKIIEKRTHKYNYYFQVFSIINVVLLIICYKYMITETTNPSLGRYLYCYVLLWIIITFCFTCYQCCIDYYRNSVACYEKLHNTLEKMQIISTAY